jgi:hypothetical protein
VDFPGGRLIDHPYAEGELANGYGKQQGGSQCNEESD